VSNGSSDPLPTGDPAPVTPPTAASNPDRQPPSGGNPNSSGAMATVGGNASGPRGWRMIALTVLGLAASLYTLAEVNLNLLQPQSALAVFVMLGTAAWALHTPRLDLDGWSRLAVGAAAWLCFGYIVLQTEPMFRDWWPDGQSLGNRVARETWQDIVIASLGLVVVLYTAGRSVGWILPSLAILLCGHSLYCYYSAVLQWPELPDWLLPHRGQRPSDLVSTVFLQSQGVLGQAMSVMFRYVFLFIVFGAMLEMSGATGFIIDFSQRMFGRSPGGPAKMAVLSSGMMGSLSGSAVANAVTTGAFTIPMMRNSGFKSHDAAAVEAAAGSGGALVPPVMGAGAYMMLEFIQPAVSYLDIVRAALLPAMLYYFSLFVSVHFYARRYCQRTGIEGVEAAGRQSLAFEGLIFFTALGSLIGLLIGGASPFRAVTGATVVILVLSLWRPRLSMHLGWRLFGSVIFLAVLVGHQLYLRSSTDFFALADGPTRQAESLLNSAMLAMAGLIGFAIAQPGWRGDMLKALRQSILNGIPLITAAACVGIVIGVVQQSGVANDFSSAMRGLVDSSLLLALLGIMVSSIVLGMGVPSVVCYLLIATIMGSLLENLGVPPLAAHLFIFYFGMMSMVTPPVALAAYAAASIAGADAMRASWSAFRFALVGFTLPFMFVYRPVLLLLAPDGSPMGWPDLPFLLLGLLSAVMGIVALAAALQGYLWRVLSLPSRLLLAANSLLLVAPNLGGRVSGAGINLLGLALFVVLFWSLRPPHRHPVDSP